MTTEDAIAQAHRTEWAAVLAATVRLTRDFDAAEDAVQEAFSTALVVWRRDGVPPNPGGWLSTTARRKALDRMRRASALTRKLQLLVVPAQDPEVIEDQRLRLVFTCCHPALALHARVALTLRLVCGLPTAEIARLFLVPEPTMAARITTAKKKIRDAGIAYRVPAAHELTTRLPAVLAAIYLLYTASTQPAYESYTGGHELDAGVVAGRSGGTELRAASELHARACELAELLLELMPAEPEVLGLVALIRLTEARAEARFRDGAPVPLAAQDRRAWDRQAIEAALPLVPQALRGKGPYALQAAIAALHAEASAYADTDWPQILALYDELLAVYPSPTVALSRAVALAEVHGPAAALAETEHLAGNLANYYLFPAARAEFLRALGRNAEAAAEDRRAAELAPTKPEADFFTGRATEGPG